MLAYPSLLSYFTLTLDYFIHSGQAGWQALAVLEAKKGSGVAAPPHRFTVFSQPVRA